MVSGIDARSVAMLRMHGCVDFLRCAFRRRVFESLCRSLLDRAEHHLYSSRCRKFATYGGVAQLVEQTAHIRSVRGPSPFAAKKK